MGVAHVEAGPAAAGDRLHSAMEDHLVFLYQQLRQLLDAAYARPKWDDARIELITADMLRLERQLAHFHADGLLPSGYLGALLVSPARTSDPPL